MSLAEITRWVIEVAKIPVIVKLTPNISDIVMPGMSGIDLAIALQREVPQCKVLLFSGHVGAQELIDQARKLGHEFVLVQKPIHPTKLVEAIQSL